MQEVERRTGSTHDASGEVARRLALAMLALQEQQQRNTDLLASLAAVRRSRSWRLTACLRTLRAWLRPPPTGLPPLEPATAGKGRLLADPTRLLMQRTGVDEPASRRASGAGPGPRLLVDVTELALLDHGAGIQRVVRRLLVELLLAPAPGLRTEPVRLAASGGYVHARAFLARMLGMDAEDAGEELRGPLLGQGRLFRMPDTSATAIHKEKRCVFLLFLHHKKEYENPGSAFLVQKMERALTQHPPAK